MFFYCKVESSNVPLFTFIWVIPCQLIQNSELFPVHFMDFLKENSCKKKLLLNSWDLAKSCSSTANTFESYECLKFEASGLNFAIFGIPCKFNASLRDRLFFTGLGYNLY